MSKPKAPSALARSRLTPIKQLVHNKHDARQHSDEQIAQLETLITKFGFTIPVLTDEDLVILAGHGRVIAAGNAGMKKVPVTMTIDEIMDVNPKRWARDEFCHLYLWTPNNFIYEASKIMEHGGFNHRTVLTWKKPKIGMGNYFRNNTEQVLFGTIGEKKTTRVNNIPTCFEGATGVKEHSDKPDEFCDIVRRASYPTYGEAFQRKERAEFLNFYEPRKNDGGARNDNCH